MLRHCQSRQRDSIVRADGNDAAAGMTRAFVNRFCASLPGAAHSDPWGGGHDAWKVGGKLFAVIGAVDEAVSVKCRDVETAELLIELQRAERAPYLHRVGADKARRGLRDRGGRARRAAREFLPPDHVGASEEGSAGAGRGGDCSLTSGAAA